MNLRILPPEEILETTVALPPSKSMLARAMVMDYLSGRPLEVPEPDACDDVVRLHAILSAGLSGTESNAGGSATAMRFITAVAAASPGADTVVTGTDSLLRRPVGHLVEALRVLGADIEYLGTEGFPPLRVRGKRLAGGEIEIEASESSQYVSALMLVTPLLEAPLKIKLLGNTVSTHYIRLTAAMMEARGVEADVDRDSVQVYNTAYRAEASRIEPDWSAATYWYEIAALTAGWVTLPGLHESSCQADRHAATLFERLGVLTEFTGDAAELSATPDLWNSVDADMADMPDAVPAIVVTACMAGVPFRLSGVGALHAKECDRVQALVDEMARLGCLLEIEAYGNVLAWDGRRVPIHELPVFETYGDHRMAMALAPVAVFVPGIVITGAECVLKSYPEFWAHLRAAGFSVEEAEAAG